MNRFTATARLYILGCGYIIFALFLFFYSYTQVDLNMTLSRVSLWQSIQKAFQYIGYFERPLSTALYLGLVSFAFILYALVLRWIKYGKISSSHFWAVLLAITLILVFSYPAFSYDFFNYMFTAKTVLVFHKNPYAVTPLAFAPIEPWVNFMRWTHLPSAYTPLWIILTLPAYMLGFGSFLLTLWNIKIIVALAYLFTTWSIGKILSSVDKQHALLGMAIFALNPLSIIENLVSAHNDVVMMACAMAAILLAYQKRPWSSWLSLAVSIAVKLMTVVLIPVYFLRFHRWAALLAMTAGLFFVIATREVLPWYFVWILPFVALLPRASALTFVSAAFSLGLLLRYAPFLYFGHWNDPVPAIKSIVTVTPVFVSVVVLLVFWTWGRIRQNQRPNR